MKLDLSTATPSPVMAGEGVGDDRVALLAQVDFKWLMAGQGWWVDSARLHADPVYCASLLTVALKSPCFALRECACLLQTLTTNAAQGA